MPTRTAEMELVWLSQLPRVMTPTAPISHHLLSLDAIINPQPWTLTITADLSGNPGGSI